MSKALSAIYITSGPVKPQAHGLIINIYVMGSNIKEALENAVQLLKATDVKLKSVRLDKHCSKLIYINYLDRKTEVQPMPKNVALNGTQETEG